MAAKKASRKKTSQPQPSLMDYFRLSESYTSLVLGIIIVIIASILLLSFFKTRNQSTHQAASSTAISLESEQSASGTPVVTQVTTPTAVPIATPTIAPLSKNSVQKIGSTYEVKAGDDLWHIAEKVYGDGYKWVVIAKANNLTNPGIINVGNSLAIPVVMKSALPTQASETPTTIQKPQNISGETYTIVHGDDLWDIAVRAYGNGYKWVDVAKANNLVNPNVIHAGNILKIPR